MDMTTTAFLAQTAAGAAEEPARTGFGVLVAVFGGLALLAVAWSWFVRPINLALGLGTTVAMWALSYLALLQPGQFGGELLFAAVVLCALAGGCCAGRYSAFGARGVSVGLVSAVFNLMVLGAFLGDRSSTGALERGLYVAGLFAASAVLGGVGHALGRRWARHASVPEPNAAALVAGVAAAAIFCMIVLGGLVTSLEAGLAVPDWPNSFGHNMLLYPIGEMKGGVFYEHAHRLFGMLVGAAMLAAWAVIFRTQRRALPRVLVSVVLLLVIVQGVLGGLRVTGQFTLSADAADLAPSTRDGIIHGVLGQIIFALAVVLPATATAWWAGAVPRALEGARALRMLPVLALGLLGVQLFLGVAMRHLQEPPTAEAGAKIPSWALHGHITVAIIVAVVAILAGLRCSHAVGLPVLQRSGKAVMHTVGLQLALGVAALVVVLVRRGAAVPWWEAVVTTAHQALGALLLAQVALLVAQAWRFVAAPGSATAVASSSASGVTPSEARA